MSRDCPGWSGYPRRTGILRHSGCGRLDVPDCPGWSGYTEVQDIVGRVFIRILGQVCPVLLGLSKDGHACGGSCLYVIYTSKVRIVLWICMMFPSVPKGQLQHF